MLRNRTLFDDCCGSKMVEDSSESGGVKLRIVVAGDAKTGKSSLIAAFYTRNFRNNVPLVWPPKRLRLDFCLVLVIDTSSSRQDSDKLDEELKRADAVVLTYASDRLQTLENIPNIWLPRLQRLKVKVPVIVAGCMMDKKAVQLSDIYIQLQLHAMEHDALIANFRSIFIMEKYSQIKKWIECSTIDPIQIYEVFYSAVGEVLHPRGPIYDTREESLKPRCVRALKRIFNLCDFDKDGALSYEELSFLQAKCFPGAPLGLSGLEKLLHDHLNQGIDERGGRLTFSDFLFLQVSFTRQQHWKAKWAQTTWTFLREFGYNNEMRLRDDQLPAIERDPDQSVELTSEALEFLKTSFFNFADSDGVLQSAELEDLFSMAPENPWNEAPYQDATEKIALGGLLLDKFLSLWALMTLLDPIRSVENLIYIGYGGDPSYAIRVTRRRRLDRKKKQQIERNVCQCFVFGPKEAGKSALLNTFIGRPFLEEYVSTSYNRYAVNVVDQPILGVKKTLVLREIPEDGVKKLLSENDALAACDVAVFVHDSSCEPSWKKAKEMLLDVADQGEATGYEMPCLVVDLNPYSTNTENHDDSTRVSQDMGIETPINLNTKLLVKSSNIFGRIVKAAEYPHLSIPKTIAGKSRKQYHSRINNFLVFVSGVSLVAFHAYAARKKASR